MRVPRRSRHTDRPEAHRAMSDEPPVAPVARRSSRPGWRDPRLAVGLAIVAASVLLGARVMAAADDSVGVWALSKDLEAGEPITSASLERRDVRFSDQAVADRYLLADGSPPADRVAAHDLSVGELLPRSGLGEAGDTDLLEVPLAVDPGAVPASVRRGATVDVWVVPSAGTAAGDGRQAKAQQFLREVTVLDVGGSGESWGAADARRLIVGVPADSRDAVAALLSAMADGTLLVTRHG